MPQRQSNFNDSISSPTINGSARKRFCNAEPTGCPGGIAPPIEELPAATPPRPLDDVLPIR